MLVGVGSNFDLGGWIAILFFRYGFLCSHPFVPVKMKLFPLQGTPKTPNGA
ncbi:hypothetical protein A2U01_0108178, partial [Trifolium medium]|nr:hypothetical protein [Trifolium medium]